MNRNFRLPRLILCALLLAAAATSAAAQIRPGRDPNSAFRPSKVQKTAATVTTDAGGRWASPWVRDNIFAAVWDRILEWMTPPATKIAAGRASMSRNQDWNLNRNRTRTTAGAKAANGVGIATALLTAIGIAI